MRLAEEEGFGQASVSIGARPRLSSRIAERRYLHTATSHNVKGHAASLQQ